MTEPMPATPDASEPAVSVGTIAGLIAGALVLIVTRGNRGLDWLNAGELDSLKGLIALGAPLIASILIRRRVTPTSKVQAIVDTAAQQASLDKEQEIHTYLAAAVAADPAPVRRTARKT